jgi:hypothetical protein
MFAALGLDPAGHYHDLNARPNTIAIENFIAEPEGMTLAKPAH